MYGVVVYAGHDTKLVKNSGMMWVWFMGVVVIVTMVSGKTKFKRTHLDLLMNKMVFFVSL